MKCLKPWTTYATGSDPLRTIGDGSKEMPQFRRVLEPGTIKNIQIKNRISMAPMERSYANMDGSINQRYIDYLVERAKNGVGMMNVESTYVDPAGRGRIFQVGLHDDKLIPSHRRMLDAIHRFGTKVVAEIQHSGRQTTRTVSGFHVVGVSSVPCPQVTGENPRELTRQEIKQLVGKFADAARRAKTAGYDMISIHGAHGYLVNAFLSPYSNKRTDEYGGSAENRLRFAVEVYEAVRAVVGDDFPVGYRMSADEFMDGGGLTLDDTKEAAIALERAGIDYLDVSAGIYESSPMIDGPMDMPLGYLTYLAAAMKEVLSIPVIATGRINDVVLAETILENNQADFVHMVRAFHADPEILTKALKGQQEDICMCMGCNKCLDAMLKNMPAVCTVNPAASREREMELRPAEKKKKVMVIGGGVAGMEAARVAKLRGHDVVLYEKDDELGGQVRWASKGKHHEEFGQLARYRIHEVKRTGVEVRLGKNVTVADVNALQPDAVVVATGAMPFALEIPGANKPLVATSFDVLSGKRSAGTKSVVVGGGRVGAVVAEWLAENGSQVTIVEARGALGFDMEGIRAWLAIDRITENPVFDVRLNSTVERIEDGAVVVQGEAGLETLPGIDLVVLATATMSSNQLADAIAAEGKISEVYRIGDVVSPRDAADAVYEGAVVGRRI